MKNILTYAKKNWVILILMIIMVGAIFVRVYKFDDYLYFKMDQSRDAIMLTKAVENGPQYLPLLGARVGAVKLDQGFLRLGPIYYYFQYAAGVIFQSTEPFVFAYPDLFFSILAIPLLYLLARLYFSKRNSLLITAMYAFSFIIIQYSRFAWNPNPLQFFELLSFYGLLRFLNETVEKHKKWWLVVWATGMTIGSQLHFFGFFSLVGISGLLIIFHFKMWKKTNLVLYLKKESMKSFAIYAGIVALVFAIFYAPVAISDFRRNGENTKNFFEALGSKAVKKPLTEKISKDVEESLKYYCLVTTSRCFGSSLKKEYPAIILTMIIMLAGIFLAGRNLRKKTKNLLQKDFLFLLISWVGVYTILTIPVSFQLRPRFFIVVFAIPFIFLGLIFEFLEEKFKKKYAIIASILITAGIIGLNSHGTYAWFKEQANSQKKVVDVKRTLILKAKDGVTLGQLKGVTDWMYGRLSSGNDLYYYVKPEHVRPIDFLLKQKKDKNLNFGTLKIDANSHVQFFAIVPADNGIESVNEKYKAEAVEIASQQFGQLKVYEITFPSRITSDTFKLKHKRQTEDRIFWKDVFNGLTKSSK